MKHNYFYVLCIFCISLADLHAQVAITVTTGPDWKDATVYRDTRPGYEYLNNNNYGDYPRLAAVAWTHSGKPTYRRTLIQMDLQHIPPGSSIQSAVLYLYSDPTVSSSSAWNGNSQLSCSNAFFLEKITQHWDESVVTWNTQPSTTSTGRIWVGASTSTNENRQVNIASLAQGWVNDPDNNFGMKMLLENEAYWRT